MRVETDMTVYTAAAVKDALLAAVARGESELDLGAVNEIDTAGLQLLLLARREVAARDAALRVVNPSVAVLELLALCRLDGAFGIATEGTT